MIIRQNVFWNHVLLAIKSSDKRIKSSRLLHVPEKKKKKSSDLMNEKVLNLAKYLIIFN